MSAQADTATTRRRLQPIIFRMVNVPMRALLALPVRTPLSGRLMLVYFTGRKTGKRYRQPVSYVRDADTLLTPGGGRWTRNLRDGEPVRLRLGGRDLMVAPELATDPDQVERLLSVMTAKNPAVARFMPLPRDAEGRLDRPSLVNAIAHGFCVVQWRPAAPSPAG